MFGNSFGKDEAKNVSEKRNYSGKNEVEWAIYRQERVSAKRRVTRKADVSSSRPYDSKMRTRVSI
jgi:hypothetical protein